MKKLVGFSAIVLAIGCGGEISGELGAEGAGEELGAVEVDTGDKADHTLVRPIGTFDAAPGAYAGQFTKLVLMTDKTFHRETLVYCITTPCNPIATNGRYEYWRNGAGTRFIRFRTTARRIIDSYAYTFSDSTGTLKLRKINTSAWFKMLRATASWCADAGDCAAQNLIHPMCAIGPGGGWTCNQDNTCDYSCGGSPSDCTRMLCAPDTYCTEESGAGECRSYATCASVRCAAGTHCEDNPIVCFRAPCPPTAPSCVPN